MDLRQKIRNFFIPSLQNQLRPYSLRFATLLLVVLFSVAIEIAFYAYVNVAFKKNQLLGSIVSSIQSTVAEALPRVIADQTNIERRKAGVKPLAVSGRLAAAARLKAEDMARKGYFSHQSPDGSMPWDWITRSNYQYSYAGENLAVNFFDADDVVAAWMRSAPHRTNILSRDYTDVGIAAVRGVFDGQETVFVVQMFATPGGFEPVLKNFAAATTSIAKTTEVIPPISVLETENGRDLATSVLALRSESGASGTVLRLSQADGRKMTLKQRLMVSPRHLARDAYFVLLAYMALVLLIPMFMIYHNHASADRWLRFREIFVLFKQPIISALITFVCVSAALAANYIWSDRGTNIFQASIGQGAVKSAP
jgi:uncharacterized protein YkwD